MIRVSDEQLKEAVQVFTELGTKQAAADKLGIPRTTLTSRLKQAERKGLWQSEEKPKKPQPAPTEEGTEITETDNSISIVYHGRKIQTVEELLEQSNVDTKIWRIDKKQVTHWEVGGKLHQGQDQDGNWKPQTLWKAPLLRIAITLVRKQPIHQVVESLLEDLAEKRKVEIPKRKYKKVKRRRCLEISIMDPHMGLHCHLPQSDQKWDLDLCEQFYLYAMEELMSEAFAIGEMEEIHWVFGNDFSHIDNVAGTTTKGTDQPEAQDYFVAANRGERLAISAAELALRNAPVTAYQIPGNHDFVQSYWMGRVLNAWFRHDEHFNIECTPETFRCIRYGVNLIGLEHGHSISSIRMAALMANEWRNHWSETEYHEWHCGDQHRRGSSKPSAFEEQGVSVDFLPGLVAPNQWHRQKSFNFQKRAATAYILDYDCGVTHRLSVNISKYTGLYLGQ